MIRIRVSRFCIVAFLLASRMPAGQAQAGQSPASQGKPKAPAISRKVQDGQYPLPCYASVKNPPKTLNGFWNPKPRNKFDSTAEDRVSVTIGFDKPDQQLPFNCTGEPLEITVPNGQIVNLWQNNWPPSCKPTLTIVPAVTDSPVSDLLTMATKIGAFGLDATTYFYELPPLKNKILTVAVDCDSVEVPNSSAKVKLSQTVKIIYQNPPRVTVSAGLLVTGGFKSYGIQTTKTGTSSTGVATTQSTIAITGSPSAQVVPFSFANLFWSGSRKLNLSTQFALRVNPNLSSLRIEFFAAPIAFSWHDIYFAPGVHIGQHEILKVGFLVGDVTTLSKAPTGWGYRGGFGFSLSYSLKPLVKPAGK